MTATDATTAAVMATFPEGIAWNAAHTEIDRFRAERSYSDTTIAAYVRAFGVEVERATDWAARDYRANWATFYQRAEDRRDEAKEEIDRLARLGRRRTAEQWTRTARAGEKLARASRDLALVFAAVPDIDR